MDINCDLGEYEDLSAANNDAKIMPFISACNIACGGHIGNTRTMRHSVQLAQDNDVAIGAHPSYPDAANFGRRSMSMADSELFEVLTVQIMTLKNITESQNASLHHVKPHGALYNDAADDLAIAKVIVAAVAAIDGELKLYGQAHSALAEAATMANQAFVPEAFVDRRYLSRHRLLPRIHRDALIEDISAQMQQARSLIVDGGLSGHDGRWFTVRCKTLCLHGDQPQALATAQALQRLLNDLGEKMARP
ncbi:MAG: LamB/YcsF family protein [Proteobacteria bacterium]|nr:MAG: LamB/YcsF family protein [Pseudomonadota bacterium]